MSMDGLRQGAKQINSGKGKGAIRSSYYARWKPPQLNDSILKNMTPDETRGIQVAEPIVLIKADYEDLYQKVDENGHPLTAPVIQPAYRFREHTFAVTVKPRGGGRPFQSYRTIVCSAGVDQHAPQPCVGCYYNDHGEKCAPRDQWAFNIAHLAWYHMKPLVKDNQVVFKKDKPGEPVMVKDECLTHNMENIVRARADQYLPQGQGRSKACEACQQQAEFIWGDHRILQVGKGQLENILAFDDELAKTCANCNTNLITVAYVCKRCQEDVLDVASSGFTNAQLKQFADSPVQCRCGNVDRPAPMYDCGYDQKMNKLQDRGCPENVDPRPLSIFDVVLWVQREGEATKSEIVIKSWTPISQFAMPDGSLSPDGRPLSEVLKDIVGRTYNMVEMYSPQKLDEQAKTIDHQDPYASQQQQYSSYGQQPGHNPQPGYGPPQGGMAPPPGQQYAPGPQQHQPYPQQQGHQPAYPNMPQPGRPNYSK
jgi:hypothetical protein